jgi:alkylated DNA repair dioxygenase AlkB
MIGRFFPQQAKSTDATSISNPDGGFPTGDLPLSRGNRESEDIRSQVARRKTSQVGELDQPLFAKRDHDLSTVAGYLNDGTQPASAWLQPTCDMRRKSSLPPAELPEGFVYHVDFLSEAEHEDLVRNFAALPFQAYDYHGFTAKRRVASYGLKYDFETQTAALSDALPEFLLALRDRAATFAGFAPQGIAQGMVTEYPPGAPIGWHRDSPQFGTVIGVSLLTPARMRFKPYKKEGRLVSLVLEPRSIYVMSGPARWQFQHSIPALEQLRYSITFRTLRENRKATDLADN